jgi:hypothetical protein
VLGLGTVLRSKTHYVTVQRKKIPRKRRINMCLRSNFYNLTVKRRLPASKTPNSVPDALLSQVGSGIFFLQHALSSHSGFSIGGLDEVKVKMQTPARISNGKMNNLLVEFLITSVFQCAKLLMYLFCAILKPAKTCISQYINATAC